MAGQLGAEIWNLDLLLSAQQPGNTARQRSRSIFNINGGVTAQHIVRQYRLQDGSPKDDSAPPQTAS